MSGSEVVTVDPIARPRSVGVPGLARLCVASLAFTAGLNGIIPMLRVYELDFPMSAGDKALVYGIYALVVVPYLLILGAVADAHGPARVMLGGFVLAIAGTLLLAWADSLQDLLAARTLQAVSGGAFWSSIGAMAREITPDERRNDAMLIASSAGPLGTGLGAIVFGVLASATSSASTPWFLYVAVFVPAVVAFATIPAATGVQRDRFHISLGIGPESRAIFGTYLFPVAFATAIACSFTLGLSPDLIEAAGGSSSPLVGGVIAGIMMTVSFVAQLATRRVRRMGPVGLGGLALMIAGVLGLIGVQRVEAAAWVSLVAVGIGFGLAFRAILVIAEHTSAPATRAKTLSTCIIAQYLGFGVGPLAAGTIADRWGMRIALGAVAATCGIALVSALVGHRKVGG